MAKNYLPEPFLVKFVITVCGKCRVRPGTRVADPDAESIDPDTESIDPDAVSIDPDG